MLRNQRDFSCNQ